MKKISLFLIMFMVSLAYAGFEYGGSTVFLENQHYQDGYRNNRSAAGANTFQSTRTYLTGFYKFDDSNKIRLTLDSSGFHKLVNSKNSGNASSNGYTDSWVFVKYLYWEKKNIAGFDTLYLGQIETPWIGYEEKLWEKRFMAKSLLDQYAVTNSADRGIGVKSKLFGNDEYHLVIDGGNGYKVANVDNRYNLEGRYTYFLTEKIAYSLGGGTGWQALKGLTLPASQQDWAEVARVDYLVGNVCYKAKDDLILSWTGYQKAFVKDTAVHSSGTSLTAVKTVLSGLDLIARLDSIDPDAAANHDKTRKSILGASYTLNENLTVAYSRQADANDYAVSSPVHVDYLQAQINF